MANYYLQFSGAIEHIDTDERDWIERQLDIGRWAAHAPPEWKALIIDRWGGVRRFRLVYRKRIDRATRGGRIGRHLVESTDELVGGAKADLFMPWVPKRL